MSTKSCNFEEVPNKQQCTPENFRVEPSMTYRLRVISTTSLASLNLQIGGHKMTVVEADGNYVSPFVVEDLDIYSGESYSVLVTTNQGNSKNYWISASVRGRNPKTPQALAVLNYAGNSWPTDLPPIAPTWDDYPHSKSFVNKLRAHKMSSSEPPPKISQHQITLVNTQTEIKEHLLWAINGVSLTLPPTPYLGAIKYGLKNSFDQDPPPYTYIDSHDISSPKNDPNTKVSSGVYDLEEGKVIDVIIQNANMLHKEKHSEIHPWHLHGHDFWVMGYGEGKFSKDRDEPNFNTEDPPLKNTVSVFPDGWTALRFKADNPGVWAFHCHLEPHLHMGMGIIFAEGRSSIEKMDVPDEALACGDTVKYLMSRHLAPQYHNRPSYLAPAPSTTG